MHGQSCKSLNYDAKICRHKTLTHDMLLHKIKDMKRKRGKTLNAYFKVERIGVRIPAEVKAWLLQLSNKEGKSLSLLLTEILEEARKNRKA